MSISIDAIKKLRAETDAAVSDCRQALEETQGDYKLAVEYLRKKAVQKAEKKAEREVKSGWVFSYIHHTGRVGAIVSLACETDFVAKNAEFQKLGRELALHITASQPESVAELLEQEYVRDSSKTITDVIKEVIGRLGENMQVVEFKVLSI